MKSRRAFLGGLSAFVSAPVAAAASQQGQDSVLRPRPQTPLVAAPNAELKLLRRVTNGITPDDVNAILAYGYNGYLEYQLNPAQIDDSACDARLASYTTLGTPTPQLYALDSGLVQTHLVESTILRAIYSKRQLLEKMVEFWTDHFNSDINTVGILKTADVRDVLRANALTTFPQMLVASAKSPAMINRLNNQQNSRTAPNQNYAREVMELHTMGVTGGYTQADIVEVARCFTGWRYNTTTNDPSRGLFAFNTSTSVRDTGNKLVLGNTIVGATGTAGINDGLTVLRILGDHLSTRRFLATKLLRWFVSYDPTEAQIADVAEVYRQTGGDIKAILRRVLSFANITWASPLYKRPFHYLASGLRAMNANITRYDTLRYTWLAGMGHLPFNWPAPNGYPQSFEYWSTLVLPRWNFAFSLGLPGGVGGATIDTTALLAGANTGQRIADRLDVLLMGGQMRAADKQRLILHLSTDPPETARVRDAFGLALASPGFQWY
jgi:Protein of unknown function (DUF1800)